MLKIAILTNHSFVLNTTEFILNQNQLNYQLLNHYEQGVHLVVGEASLLKDLPSRVMIIALMDSHEYDNQLSKMD